MPGLMLVNIVDVARSLGPNLHSPTAESVAGWLLHEYLERRGGRFNYDTSISTLHRGFRGELSLAGAIEHCRRHAPPAGLAPNIDVVEVIWPHVTDNVGGCYPQPYKAIRISRAGDRTIYIGVKAPLVRVRNERAFVVTPGFRQSAAPTERQIDFVCSVVHAQIAKDNFGSADVEYLEARSFGAKAPRELRVIHGSDRFLFGRDEIEDLLSIYLRGVLMLLESGVGSVQPNLTRYHVVDPDQFDLWL